MTDERFLQKGFDKLLAHTIQECGEFLAAAGKTQMFGIASYNPLIPVEERETNFDWVYRELEDVLRIGTLLKTEMERMREDNVRND